MGKKVAKESVVSKLRALKKIWRNATPRRGGGLPDGEYERVIKTGIVGLAKSESRRLQCVWTIDVTAPDGFEGRKQTKIAGLETEDNLSWFQGDLEILGVDLPDDSEDIADAVGQTEGMPIAFRVRTKQEFTNVDFIGLLEGVEADVPDDNTKPEESEDGGLTAEEVADMGDGDDEKGLQEIINDHDLGIDQNDYVTYSEVANLVIEALEL